MIISIFLFIYYVCVQCLKKLLDFEYPNKLVALLVNILVLPLGIIGVLAICIAGLTAIICDLVFGTKYDFDENKYWRKAMDYDDDEDYESDEDEEEDEEEESVFDEEIDDEESK